MAFVLLHAGTPLGRVELDDAEPAGGYLEPSPAYAPFRDVFQLAGDLQRARWASVVLRLMPPSPSLAAAARHAEDVMSRLALATEDGMGVEAVRIEVADATGQGEPPFVLVHWREQPAAVPARLRPPPGAGAGGAAPPA